MSSYSLSDLISDLVCSDASRREAAWKKFLADYHELMYNFIHKICVTMGVNRLNVQMNDAVHDILCSVLHILCDRNYHALKSFQHVENEEKFRAWLLAVCRRATIRYLTQAYLKRAETLSEEYDPPAPDNVTESLEIWEIYHQVQRTLRGLAGGQERNLERDLHIFFLYIFAGFKADEIRQLPGLRKIGPRVVDNVVNRFRKKLRNAYPDFRLS